jgi:predicted peroxiredoxin/TusA-related sulfurtransferase
MRTIKALGIKSPNLSIMVENIIKNGLKEELEDGLIVITSPGSEKGIEKVTSKYGFQMELEEKENQIVIRMTKSPLKELDVSGETCPGPIVLAGDYLTSMGLGERVKVLSIHSETIEDIAVAMPDMGGKVVENGQIDDKYYIVLEKGEKKTGPAVVVNKDKVLVVQSNGIGNAERAYATFIFAQAAQSMGKEVEIFTLMDGVSILKKGNAEKVKHPAFDRLDKLMQEVIESGIKIYVCELSANFRGIKQEDLVAGAKIAGAATYVTLLSDPRYAVVNF